MQWNNPGGTVFPIQYDLNKTREQNYILIELCFSVKQLDQQKQRVMVDPILLIFKISDCSDIPDCLIALNSLVALIYLIALIALCALIAPIALKAKIPMFLLLGYQAVTQGKNKLPHGQY